MSFFQNMFFFINPCTGLYVRVAELICRVDAEQPFCGLPLCMCLRVCVHRRAGLASPAARRPSGKKRLQQEEKGPRIASQQRCCDGVFSKSERKRIGKNSKKNLRITLRTGSVGPWA